MDFKNPTLEQQRKDYTVHADVESRPQDSQYSYLFDIIARPSFEKDNKTLLKLSDQFLMRENKEQLIRPTFFTNLPEHVRQRDICWEDSRETSSAIQDGLGALLAAISWGEDWASTTVRCATRERRILNSTDIRPIDIGSAEFEYERIRRVRNDKVISCPGDIA